MRDDERVFVIGEDVAEGGPYTRHRRAGGGVRHRARAQHADLARAAICGVAVGAAQSGMRPIVEVMFIDFVTLALDQLVNQAAKAHAMSGGQLRVPLVLRTQGGAGRAGARSTRRASRLADPHPRAEGRDAEPRGRRGRAAGSAVADPNPVVFVENKTLYFKSEDVPESAAAGADRAGARGAPGSDVTIVALSRLVDEALAAAERLAGDGIEAEVIDPRTLVPLDLDTIVESVGRTNRLVIAHEAVEHGGFGAEIAAQVQAGRRSTTWTRRSNAWAPRSRRSRSARRWRTPTCRAPTRSTRRRAARRRSRAPRGAPLRAAGGSTRLRSSAPAADHSAITAPASS